MKQAPRTHFSKISDRNTKTFRAIEGTISYYDSVNNVASVSPLGTTGDNLKNCFVNKGLAPYAFTGARCLVLYSESHNTKTVIIIAIY